MIICAWLIWPGAMFASAAIFESRKVYLGPGQSVMFFPGDLALGICIVMVVGMHALNPVGWTQVYQPLYWTVTGILCAGNAYVIHIPDAGRYKDPRSRTSPTKLTHDFFGYFICPWVLAAGGIPELIWSIETKSFSTCWYEWAIFCVAAAFLIGMAVIDITHPPTDEERLLMHPAEYKPCWKKKGHSQ